MYNVDRVVSGVARTNQSSDRACGLQRVEHWGVRLETAVRGDSGFPWMQVALNKTLPYVDAMLVQL